MPSQASPQRSPLSVRNGQAGAWLWPVGVSVGLLFIAIAFASPARADQPGQYIGFQAVPAGVALVRPGTTTGSVHGSDVAIVGIIGHSALVDGLIRDRKLEASPVAGRWEAFLIDTVRGHGKLAITPR